MSAVVRFTLYGLALVAALALGYPAHAQVGGPLMGQASPAVTPSGTFSFGPPGDVNLVRDGGSALGQRTGASPQAFRIYNTWTDSVNYERLALVWSSNTLLAVTQSAGTGTARPMVIGTSGAATLTLRTGGTDRWSVGATAGELIGASATGFVQTPKFVSSGGTPVMGACGTTPAVAGSDSGMQITVGSGGVATTCAVTFSSAFGAAPACVAQNNTDRVSYSVVTSTTVLTITATAAFTAGSIFHVVCIGR